MAAIVAGDILFKLSVTTGAAGNATTSTPAGSLGKYISTTALSGTALNNLFDDVSGAENTAGTTDYRCFFVHNSNTANILQAPVIYLSGGDPAGGAVVTIAVDNIAASAIGSAGAQAALIASETTAPTGVGAYSAPSTIGTGLALGDIGIGQCKAVWVKRVTSSVAAVTAETVTFAVTGDTGAL